MADIQIWALRNAATKALMGWSRDPFETQAGQEQLQVTIDDSDLGRFSTKYRFNPSSGALEINGKTFHQLQITDDAAAHNPVDGAPQIDKGGAAYITVTLQKEDIDGNDLTGAGDDDTVLIRLSGGNPVIKDSGGAGAISQIDLATGTAQFRIYSDTNPSVATLAFMSVDLKDGAMTVESV